MRLLLSELRLRRTSLVVWVVSVFALLAMIVAFYPEVRADPSLNSLYANMSRSMQALLGGSDLTSPTGYLNTQVFAFFLPAVLLVFGLGRGAASIASEEEERTLDLLLAQPVPRWSAYLQKAAAVAIGITSLTLATWVVLAAMNTPVKFDLPAANLAAVCLQMGLFCLALSLAAQAIAAATGRRAYGLSGRGRVRLRVVRDLRTVPNGDVAAGREAPDALAVVPAQRPAELGVRLAGHRSIARRLPGCARCRDVLLRSSRPAGLTDPAAHALK